MNTKSLTPSNIIQLIEVDDEYASDTSSESFNDDDSVKDPNYEFEGFS